MIIRDCLLVIFIDKADRFGYLYRIVNVGWPGAGPGEEPTRVCRKEESLIDGMEW